MPFRVSKLCTPEARLTDEKNISWGVHIQRQSVIQLAMLGNTCNNIVILSAATHAMSIRGDTAHARLMVISRAVQEGLLVMLVLGWGNPMMAKGLQRVKAETDQST